MSLGFQAKLYRNDASFDAPDWQEITNVKDCKVNATFDKAETTTRGDGGFKTYQAGLQDLSVAFGVQEDSDDADALALRAAGVARSNIDVMALTGDLSTPGSWGWRFIGQVFDLSLEQNLADPQMIPMEILPTRTIPDQRPQYVVIE